MLLKLSRPLKCTVTVSCHWPGGDVNVCHLITAINSKANAVMETAFLASASLGRSHWRAQRPDLWVRPSPSLATS